MFRSIISKIPTDSDYPDRRFTLDIYQRVLDGALYEHLEYGFHQEKNGAGEYIPLRERRPCVRYNVCGQVVFDSVSLLFSEGHFPSPLCQDKPTKEALAALIKEAKLNAVMLEAATIGSVGSVAIHMTVREQKDKSNRAFYEARSTEFLTPTFSPDNPDELLKVREQYKIKGSAVKAMGYAVVDTDLVVDFWFVREWDEVAETWFVPYKVSAGKEALQKGDPLPEVEDDKKSVKHDLGFVPWVWVRNLPGKLRLLGTSATPLRYSDIDGACTFAAAIESMIEIEYTLSQGGRGLKYSMDPTLVLKEPAMPGLDPETGGQIVKGPANALIVDGENGDAKLLELSGSAFSVVMDWVKALRELALENTHGNRAEASKLSSAQSGRAMELMNQALIWLADRLRVSYGEGAFLQLLQMTLKAHKKLPLTIGGKVAPAAPENVQIALKWPKWHAPTSTDLRDQATTLTALAGSGLISEETAVTTIADDYDIEDVPAELSKIAADKAAAAQVAVEIGAQDKAASDLAL